MNFCIGGVVSSFLLRLSFIRETAGPKTPRPWGEWSNDQDAMAARAALQRNLGKFKPQGLSALRRDLKIPGKVGTTWKNCPLSYREGYAGSVNCDTNNYACDSFTMYSSKHLPSLQQLILHEVELEIARRRDTA